MCPQLLQSIYLACMPIDVLLFVVREAGSVSVVMLIPVCQQDFYFSLQHSFPGRCFGLKI